MMFGRRREKPQEKMNDKSSGGCFKAMFCGGNVNQTRKCKSVALADAGDDGGNDRMRVARGEQESAAWDKAGKIVELLVREVVCGDEVPAEIQKKMVIDCGAQSNAKKTVEGVREEFMKSNLQLPPYWRLLAAQCNQVAIATFSMPCYWVGEGVLGGVDGVVSTTAGWQQLREVVRAEYDPATISAEQLEKIAKISGFKPRENATRVELDRANGCEQGLVFWMVSQSEQKVYLRRRFTTKTGPRLLPIQAARLNALCHSGIHPTLAQLQQILSPSQIQSLRHLP
mmetsp:Transcript_4736/g.10120  ORF Transcript_4736/g.10120 Transcript_4736/m.10120 type:complete len:284 (-) Transcript_4736:884-1735(-)